MPWKPKHICSYAGCNELTHDRYCDSHKRQITKEHNQKNSKLYTYRWHKKSKAFLRAHPLCAHCLQAGRVTEATEVDHIIPHNGDIKLFWDQNNWQSLCKKCHSKKTAQEDGGFGNPVKNL
ncbi:HNH endonuclease [Heliorestis acidaminivorans]|uniref:Putative HNH nuclease YajD n=1 Tax=Heliorestis acidaminivorans TaxID=553427 RepID=A0A6I0F2T8_9FIRM|nr:HNH endonuclease [Heliorestis acidaminivorans]KAB2953733.1 HNH endonuclease [Heliorestis acidaminivorans]